MEGLEGVHIGSMAKEDEPGTKNCKWKDCKSNHRKDLAYPEGGTVERNSTYAADWVAANLEPWIKYGDGIDSLAQKPDYLAETPAASYVATASAMQHPCYHTQKHHLISVKLFANRTRLAFDAKLVGYDVNHKNNGVCLPSYCADIVRHDLQCHRGNHPNSLYYDHLDPLLRDLETKAAKYCHVDFDGDLLSQRGLVDDLDMVSRRTENQLKSWKWLLRSDAPQERIGSKADLTIRRAKRGK